MKRLVSSMIIIIVFSILFGCTSSNETSTKLIPHDLVHLNNGTPTEVKDYFEKK